MDFAPENPVAVCGINGWLKKHFPPTTRPTIAQGHCSSVDSYRLIFLWCSVENLTLYETSCWADPVWPKNIEVITVFLPWTETVGTSCSVVELSINFTIKKCHLIQLNHRGRQRCVQSKAKMNDFNSAFVSRACEQMLLIWIFLFELSPSEYSLS